MKNYYILKKTFLKKNLKLNFIIIFFCVIQYSLLSQTYNFTTYNNSNSGIGFNSVSDIKVDNNGSLWLSSGFDNGGVTRFDGTNWSNYNTSNSGIIDNIIIDIEIDNLNRKWFGSWQNGISKLEGTIWTNYTTSNSQLPSNSVNDLSIDNSNNIWIATNQGLTKFNGTTWITYNTSNSGISSNSINSVMVDELNNIWLNTSNKLIKFNGSTWSIYAENTSLYFWKILKIKNNIVYLAGGGGLIKFENNLFNHFSYFNNSPCIIDCVIEDIDFDSQNNLWVGYIRECSIGGLQNFNTCTNYFSTNSGLPENNISSMKIDNSNNIWIGTYSSGLVKMSLNNLGLEEISSDKKLLISPNPTQNRFTINDIENSFGNLEYKIIDFTGRIIKNGKSKFNEQINIENLTSGNFIVQISTEDGKITTEKLIKN
jgi:hypothetical protein